MQPSEIDVVAEYRDEQRAFFHAVRGALSATSQNGRNTFYSVLAARKKIVRQDKKKKNCPPIQYYSMFTLQCWNMMTKGKIN